MVMYNCGLQQVVAIQDFHCVVASRTAFFLAVSASEARASKSVGDKYTVQHFCMNLENYIP